MVTPCEDGALARIYRRGTLGLRPAWILEGVWCPKSRVVHEKMRGFDRLRPHGLRHGWTAFLLRMEGQFGMVYTATH